MITLSNGHKFKYMVASGALAFDGLGWFWERLLVWLGLIKPELFTVVLKTLTLEPLKGNLCWWKPWTWLPFSPWSCVRFIPGGTVNKVGLTNRGFNWWCEEVMPEIDFDRYSIVVSIFGKGWECVQMAKRLNRYEIVAIEVNVSCPNSGDALKDAKFVVDTIKAVAVESRHPVIVKVSVGQDYLAIAEGLKGVAQAISLNSVPWKIAFPNGEITPLRKLEARVGGGGGGVSGKPAQKKNWEAVEALARQGALPVIAPSIMEFADLARVDKLGASAYSFGAIHCKSPVEPTKIVMSQMCDQLMTASRERNKL